MQRQGNNHDTMLDRKHHNMNLHLTFSIVHDKNLVLYRRTRLLMKMLKCLHETFTVHPTIIRMQYTFGTEDSVPHESWVPLASGNHKHWREGLPHSMYNPHKLCGASSFPSHLLGYWLTPRTHNLNRLQNCGQGTLIQIVYLVWSEFIFIHS